MGRSAPLIERIRGVALLLTMMIGGLGITCLTAVLLPFAPLYDKTYQLLHIVTAFIVKLLLRPFIPKIEIVGAENLDQKRTPRAVMVANHQSSLDAFIFGDLWNVNFRVTFKHELLYYPGIGSTMWLAGYLPVKRGNRGSGTQLLERCASLLEKNVWVLFFPEGTRKIDGTTGPLGPFKAGAFKLALDAGVPIVPITISGARNLMPARGYPSLGFGAPKLIVHPPLSTAGKTVEQLMQECHDILASSLGPEDMLAPQTPSATAEGARPSATVDASATDAAAEGGVRRRRKDGEATPSPASSGTR